MYDGLPKLVAFAEDVGVDIVAMYLAEINYNDTTFGRIGG